MSSTSAMRRAWGPPCKGPWATITLHGGGKVTVRHAIVPAVLALNEVLKQHNYRTRRGVTGAYNCRKITGGSGYSLHAYGIAIDINWDHNPYGRKLVTDMPLSMAAEIERLHTVNHHQVWRWGGNYRGHKDAMHYEIVCSPHDLATGIAGHTGMHPEVHATNLGEILKVIDFCSHGEFHLGDHNQCVGVLQRVLVAKAGQHITPDEQFGPATEEAVRNVQRISGLKETGVADKAVWDTLKKAR